MQKKNRGKKGILFWITGLSGSGKTRVGKKIHKFISKNFGPTIVISGDDLRKIFSLRRYDFKSRIKYCKYYSKFCRKITNQGINVIMCVVCLSNQARNENRKNFSNYFEIYIKSKIKLIKVNTNKRTYKNKSNIWGIDLKPEFPKNYDVVITNNFSRNINSISSVLEKKIEKKFNLRKNN